MKLTILLLAALIIPSAALAQAGTWNLARQTVSTSGGGFATNYTWNLYASIGEPLVGISRNPSWTLYAGFLFPRWKQGSTEITRLPQIPSGLRIHQNYPNPVTSAKGYQTCIMYELDAPADVQLNLYDLLGQHVVTLANYPHPAGVYHATFQVPTLPAGTYLVELRTSNSAGIQMRRISMKVLR